MKPEDGLVVGIDASRNRSGGARAHLQGIIREFDERTGIKTLHLWAYRSLLDVIDDRPWLIKHAHPFLERSLAFQLFWQAFKLKTAARSAGCDILFSTDASTVCNFSPLVVLSQDLLSYEPGVMQSYAFGRDRLRLEVIKILQNNAFRRAKGVLFLSKYAADIVQKSSGILPQTSLAPHGIDDYFRDIATSEVRQQSGVSVGLVKCVYVSNVDIYKHQDHVVEAIRVLRDSGLSVELTLIGGGIGPAKSKLDNAIKRCDPHGLFVRQLDFVEHAELPRHLEQANIYIFASSCENLPVTLLEGMAAGLPIACSNRGPMPEVLQDGGVYFDPENISSIAAAIQRLIDSQDLCKEVTKRAQRIASEYSWAICSKKTFEFIRDTALEEYKNL